MIELVRYDAMCRAIDAAYEIDEVKDIRDKARVLEVYAPFAGVIAFTREAALFVALAVAGAAHADPMVCTTEAGVTHCEAPLNHRRVIGTRKGNRTYFEDNKGRRWMMIEEEGRTTVMPR